MHSRYPICFSHVWLLQFHSCQYEYPIIETQDSSTIIHMRHYWTQLHTWQTVYLLTLADQREHCVYFFNSQEAQLKKRGKSVAPWELSSISSCSNFVLCYQKCISLSSFSSLLKASYITICTSPYIHGCNARAAMSQLLLTGDVCTQLTRDQVYSAGDFVVHLCVRLTGCSNINI